MLKQKVILSGSSLNDHNVIQEIVSRATEKKQGAEAIFVKAKGRKKKVFLMVDNRQLLVKKGRSRQTFIYGADDKVVFPAIP
ncbi:MAG TPA: hypothetical protein P5548_04200 [Candidatus Moranbacteria bacterium]|nr:hypothetical protein [Candidatus Moranbacteria bacterium]HRZ34071.1 hypothetical protein [Candidatus Moranbacteria bacterium]